MKISVVIPVYNVEEYLSKCVHSVLRQDYHDFEILLVDDGSTDSGPAIADDFAAQYPEKVVTLHQQNKGLGGARNTGLEKAGGEYLFFLDSDDTMPEGTLSFLAEKAEQNDADIVIFNTLLVDDAGKEVGKYQGCEKNETVFNLHSYPALLTEVPSATNKLFRKTLFTQTDIRFPDRVWYEDLRTTPKLYTKAERIIAFDRIGYNYLQRQGSIMNNSALERVFEIADAVADVIDYYQQNGLYDAFAPQLEHLAFKHQYMLATRRINEQNRKSPVQTRLRDDFIKRYPNYRNDAFFAGINSYDRTVSHLIEKKQYFLLNLIYKTAKIKNNLKRSD